ncbi:hypothetical protein [Amycolatopsis sp. NPDC051128]|uniref:hypothetical protein n=1 Tax=Amycolatopsis sp. NPDC051128 TaxID=3155412 RepID=UPI00342B9899
MPDLDDTSRCPLGRRCATCSTEDDLAIGTAVTPVGVFCITLCGTCAEKGDTPSIGYPAAAMQVMVHCSHLDIDLDEMAAALAAERVQAVAR